MTSRGSTSCDETERLETGGGVHNALPLLGELFFVVNSDVLWLDGTEHALTRLAHAFDPERMDAVLLLQRSATAVGYEGSGDFLLDPLGSPRRRGEREIAPFCLQPACNCCTGGCSTA